MAVAVASACCFRAPQRDRIPAGVENSAGPPPLLTTTLSETRADDFFPLWPTLSTNSRVSEVLAGTPFEANLHSTDIAEICKRRHQPEFSMAASVADPDVSLYVSARCQVMDQYDVGIDSLAAIATQKSAISNVAWQDLLVVLAEQGNAVQAIDWLGRHALNGRRDLDPLVAAFETVGKTTDALAILDAQAQAQPQPSSSIRCERTVNRAKLLTELGLYGSAASSISDAKAQSSGASLSCYERATAIQCYIYLEDLAHRHQVPLWRANTGACASYLARKPATKPEISLIASIVTWPKTSSNPMDWLNAAILAEFAVPLPGSIDIALSAIEYASSLSRCNQKHTQPIEQIVRRLSLSSPTTIQRKRTERLRKYVRECR
jgi:hypothetical protein